LLIGILLVQQNEEHTIKELIEPLLDERDLFLLEINIRGSKNKVVTIYVDSGHKGVNVDECSEVSRELGFLIDAHELFTDSYRLNISSPGLSRPLSDYRQYKKNKNRKVKIKHKSNGEYLKLQGTLKEIEEDRLLVETDEGTNKEISFENIVETKIIPAL